MVRQETNTVVFSKKVPSLVAVYSVNPESELTLIVLGVVSRAPWSLTKNCTNMGA